MLEYQQTKVDLLKLITFLKYNKKAYTANTLSKNSTVDKKIVDLFLSSIEKLDYLKIFKSPSGRFINFKFTPFSKNIYYSDHACIIERGHVTEGVYNSWKVYSNSGYFQRKLAELPDLAKTNNALYVRSVFKPEDLCDEILKMNNILEKKEEVLQKDLFEEYPFVKTEIQRLEKKKELLEKEIQDEIELNATNKKWFDDETRKADRGERYREVAQRGRYLGKKTIYGPRYQVKDSEWNGGNTYWTSNDEEVDEYETVYKKVPDYPKEILPVYTKQYENKSKILSVDCDLHELKTYPMKWNKIFNERLNKENEIKLLEKQKKELEDKIKKLKM